MSTLWMLSEDTSQVLLALPETGMGFQFVEGLSNSIRMQLLVFNSEIAYDVTDLQLSDEGSPATILLNGTRLIQGMRSAVEVDGTLGLSSITVAPPRVVGGGGPTAPPSGPASSVAPPSGLVTSYPLPASRMFYRFSAYNPDKRVNPSNGDFAAGTYATTDSDHPLATSGFAAVGRYALPNVLSAFYRYQIEVPKGTNVTTGTVAPAFGQSGGGVEALFAAAVSNLQWPAVVFPVPED